MRFFNTAGPIRPEKHYCIPPLERLDLPQVLRLIGEEKYFVLHAPRQTGKTSALLALRDLLNAQGDYRCLYINVEVGQAAREDTQRAMQAILSQLALRAQQTLDDEFVEELWFDVLQQAGPDGALQQVLSQWSAADQTPLVLLVDEIDALVGDTLVSVLRQLRAGYDMRPKGFPQSVVLCGVRDVRDYRIQSTAENAVITGGSAFNIKAESLRLGDFSRPEALALLEQHTAATGQVFMAEALDTIWEQTQGQPWLVNALAYEACFKIEEAPTSSHPIQAEAIWTAQERLIARRETHLDQLADKLREERVQRIVEPLLSGAEVRSLPSDDLMYARDLGLVHTEDPLRIANPIYREVIPRELVHTTQATLAQDTAWYVDSSGGLDMGKLLPAFQAFFREHSEHWVERFQYKEAGPQLLLQAFLQRIVNSGGRIEREYGLGRMRTDLLIVWPHEDQVRRFVIECKVLHKSLEKTIAEGVVQTAEYMDRCDAEAGHLIIFDRREGRRWDDKVFHSRRMSDGGVEIDVWGM